MVCSCCMVCRKYCNKKSQWNGTRWPRWSPISCWSTGGVDGWASGSTVEEAGWEVPLSTPVRPSLAAHSNTMRTKSDISSWIVEVDQLDLSMARLACVIFQNKRHADVWRHLTYGIWFHLTWHVHMFEQVTICGTAQNIWHVTHKELRKAPVTKNCWHKQLL